MSAPTAVKVMILSGYGLNCESETAHAFETAGASCSIVHINDLIANKHLLETYDVLVFPGGFSYGDDTGSGNAFANKCKNNIWPQLQSFIDSGKLMLGICNGFQIMTYLGVFALPETSYGEIHHALETNLSNRYECRWVHLKAVPSCCVFTKGIERTHIPVAHGEGRFVCDEQTYASFVKHKQIVFTYQREDGTPAQGKYPHNPNGASHDVAGLCDRTGRIMGMMPHPERGLYAHSEPEYALKKELAARERMRVPEFLASNKKIFENAVAYTKARKEGVPWQ